MICRPFGPILARRGSAPRFNTMRTSWLLIPVSSLALWLGSCSVLGGPEAQAFPLIKSSQVKNTTLDRFNVRGYVVAVVICGRAEQCIVMDGVSVAAEPVPLDPYDVERVKNLRDSGQVISLYSGRLRRFGLKPGQEYLFSYQIGTGIVGVSAIE